jgi:hypothetical protein
MKIDTLKKKNNSTETKHDPQKFRNDFRLTVEKDRGHLELDI